MTDRIRVLAISGSLREASYNTALLREAQRIAPGDITVALASIKDFPLYNADLEASAFPQAVKDVSASIAESDALLIATPEYNFSIPGVLKNAIDWLSRPPLDQVLAGVPVGIVGAGGRLGSARAQYHLRQVFACLSMLPVPRPEVFVLNAWEKFDAQGRLKDELVAKQLLELLTTLADWTRLLRTGRQRRSLSNG
jgi:chromate reductase, NAD(P)H dehydrogenase (quinone)